MIDTRDSVERQARRASVNRRAWPEGAVIARSDVSNEPGVAQKLPMRWLDWPQPAGKPARGTILFQGGRGDFLEKYIETMADLHVRGWNIMGFDWRGQGGSGRWSDNPRVGHVDDFAPWIADLSAFWSEKVLRRPGPHVILGHSMGGHLVLRALVEQAIRPDAAILIAPMLGYYGKVPVMIGQWFAQMMAGRTAANRPAWPDGEKPGAPAKLREALLTHDHDRYSDELWWYDTDPTLKLGPPSWQWVAAGYRSNAMVFAPKSGLDRLEVPVMILATEGDRLVALPPIREAALRIQNAELHVYPPNVAHEILREVDSVRDDALARMTAFLNAKAPAQ